MLNRSVIFFILIVFVSESAQASSDCEQFIFNESKNELQVSLSKGAKFTVNKDGISDLVSLVPMLSMIPSLIPDKHFPIAIHGTEVLLNAKI